MMGPQSIGASLAACVQPGGGRVRSASVQRDLSGVLACDGAATRPRIVECRIACAGAQHGQGVIAVRGTRYPCVQPAAAVGFQHGGRSGEQAHGPLRVVLQPGDVGQRFEVVGGACLVPGCGRDPAALRQMACRAAQIPLCLAGQCQVVERDEQVNRSDPWRAALRACVNSCAAPL